MKALKIDTRCNISTVEINSYRHFCETLNGLPELVRPGRLSKPYCMFIDGDGYNKGLPLNLIASHLNMSDAGGNPIVGDAYLLKQIYIKGFAGLTPDDIEVIKGDISGIAMKFREAMA